MTLVLSADNCNDLNKIFDNGPIQGKKVTGPITKQGDRVGNRGMGAASYGVL
jgi:hypothetical protein